MVAGGHHLTFRNVQKPAPFAVLLLCGRSNAEI